MEQRVGYRARARSGFTLIEVIVAITIVAIMTAGAFALFRWTENAKRTRTETTVKGIQLAINTFQSDTGSYPITLNDLKQRPADATLAKRWRGPYLEGKEDQDAWYKEIQYRVNPKGSQHPYELYSWGKGGEGSPENEWVNVW